MNHSRFYGPRVGPDGRRWTCRVIYWGATFMATDMGGYVFTRVRPAWYLRVRGFWQYWRWVFRLWRNRYEQDSPPWTWRDAREIADAIYDSRSPLRGPYPKILPADEEKP